MIPPSLLALASKIGIRGGAIIALALALAASLFNTYGNFSFSGPFGWQIGWEGHKARADRMERRLDACEAARDADRASYVSAQAEAGERAVRARMAAQERYQQQAEQSHARENELRADLRDIGERFIAANRVRPQAAGGASGGTVAAPDNSDPGILADLPADAVMVAASDVRACTDLASYAIAAHDWAAGLNATP